MSGQLTGPEAESESLPRVLPPQLERPEPHHRCGAATSHHAPRHVVATPDGEKKARRGSHRAFDKGNVYGMAANTETDHLALEIG